MLKGCLFSIRIRLQKPREFHSLEVIGINELANAFVRLVSDSIFNDIDVRSFYTKKVQSL